MKRVLLESCECALDLGDGSERGFYVNQDYVLQKMKKIHRGISLMYTYYPNDKGWPGRASLVHKNKTTSGAWDYPYEDYFPYRGGKEGLRDEEPFKFMKEIRQHGMDVVLSLTMDPFLTEEEIITVAEDLRPYGRLLLRVNHECTGNWFCFNKRATYKQLADFFVLVCKVMHEHAPNVKVILCAGMWQEDSGKLDMEDIFLEAHKAADIWSGDQYLSLHWGWPYDVATKQNANYGFFGAESVYRKAKNTYLRLKEITGQDKPMVLSELNGDGDVTGPFEQAEMVKQFMELLQKDDEKWLSAFTLYQFRDDGRLGLEITDPNNSEVGIEQPLLKKYRDELHKPFFSQKITAAEEIELPVKLRWSNSEDAEGVEINCHFNKTPCYFELYFEDELADMNIMMEFGGYWFYKKPGVKFTDLMPYFYDKPLDCKTDIKLHLFCPPSDGLNYPEDGSNPFTAPDGDWMYNSYTVLPKLPVIRIEEEPVLFRK